jgi:capsid assembly protease
MDLAHIASWAASTPWAISEEKLRAISIALALRLNGSSPDAGRIQKAKKLRREGRAMLLAADGTQAAMRPGQAVEQKSVVILPVYGTICPRMHMLEDGSGGISCERLDQWITQAGNDSKIAGIVLDMDTPGGSSYGVSELAAKIRSVANSKPVLAISNHESCSAGYWIAAAASEIGVTPSGIVGSVGVYMIHQCFAEAMKQEGIETTMIQAGEFKLLGNPYTPLSDMARNKLQEWTNRVYEDFTSSVALHRGKSPRFVTENFGQGWILHAEQAKAVGMVDHVGTFQDLVADFTSRTLKPASNMNALRQKQLNVARAKQY